MVNFKNKFHLSKISGICCPTPQSFIIVKYLFLKQTLLGKLIRN